MTTIQPSPKTKKPRSSKLRPKLQPVSNDKAVPQSFEDEGLGFGDILTTTAAAKEEHPKSTTAVSPPAPSSSPPQTPTRMITPKIDDVREEQEEMLRQYYNEKDRSEEKKGDSYDDNERLLPDGGTREHGGAASPHPATNPTTVTGLDCMAQYSSITSPSPMNLHRICLNADISMNSEEDGDEYVPSPFKLGRTRDDKGSTNDNENISISKDTNKDAINQCGMGEDVPSTIGVTPPREVKDSKNDVEGSGLIKDSNEEVAHRLLTSYSESSSDSSSSSSSSSSDGAESEDEDGGNQNHPRVTRLHQLQSEIRSRQKQMAKLLRGKEGTAYAHMIQSQEDAVNTQLLDDVRIKDVSEEPSTNKDPTTETSPFGTIRSMLLYEYYCTLPCAFSLLLHCSLYVTIYGIISKFMTWLCDFVIIYLTGWHINENWFDSTYHEHIFFLGVLILSLLVTRITGVVYDWNEARPFQKSLEFQLRNKWHLKCWDAKLANYFYGDALREEYESQNSGQEKRPKQKRVWGPRLKYILDLFSFFICYKCVDHFVNDKMMSMSEITETVLDGLPSRQLHEQRDQEQLDQHLVRNGFSHACLNVMSALDNPYAVDMLNWIASGDFESEEAENWIKNAKKCGWSGTAEVKEDNDVEENGDADTGDVEKSGDTDTESNNSIESGHPTFIAQKQIVSAHDDKYLQETISIEAYYDLVGEPTPKILDPVREYLFLLVSTSVCIGLLYRFGVPFLLI
mmetsp:Transcript_42058/g.75836  ORF Transcript_42058/g.75836 Transcript_42058/m.75836 type:complete len:738 (-) Transcript_42058:269-2482(-)|eukprot:CAMPEP_0201901196 /NCGR_PEP_ID=MMETSP0902-20130614/53834_1 /ASSEMBLY_ACC=CAM_ASM_000551 /TAXON_ID=420261 /ORGANISM="Thalassiosira antarctica, Strain CCMP982" /LENGTH=737 /DNA_ID=CAMNT_0048435075 /DNA_START=193 /DNA_END=2406 /DNA_ORIENTATION=+